MSTTFTDEPLLRLRAFRNLFVAGAVSQFGSQISYVALPLLAVTALGAGPGEVGLLAALGTLTVLLLGLPAGAWVDRVRRRPVMIAADLSRAAVLLSVPLAWWGGWLGMGQLYAVAVLVGAGSLVFDVASLSLVPGVVGRDRLTAANSLLVGTGAGMDIAGRSVAGVLVQAVGAPVAILVDAVSYLWSAVWLRGVHEPRARVREPSARSGEVREPSARSRGGRETAGGSCGGREAVGGARGGEGIGRQIGAGVRFLFGDRVLVAALVQGTMANLAFPLCSVLLPVLVVEQLGYPEWVLGAYLAVGGLGTLAGSTSAHLLGRRLGTGRATLLVSLATAPASLVIPFLGSGPWLWAAAGAWFVLTFRVGVNNVLLVSLRQRVTPDDMLGRMTATMRLLLMGAVGLGGLLAGLLGEVWGVRSALWLGALIMALSWLPILRSDLRHQP
ncbi:MFS transporter [Nonomuraea jiangxiensis]|uniref:Major Facilitator Superfamily protein n=1 Tax=Nonomuraea jiangxiensis TaxID=633440 RepID=A0A1G8FEW2_9ACTN|nr:MFS transporter [Nonomuraea jiangxiensis]SDH80698.1 Major Facilitator Superfamily protein [Nonomuraea jiangxiensis]